MFSHTRERKPVVSAEVPDDVFENLTHNETRAELLSPKGDTSRANWLAYVLKDLSLPDGSQTGGEVFNEVLEFCLSQTKNSSIFVPAAKVATLSVLWSLDVNESIIESALFELLNKWKHKPEIATLILACLICVTTTSENVSVKMIETLLRDDICPQIHEEADRVVAEQSGDVLKAEDEDEEEGDFLIEYMEAWQACLPNLEASQISSQIKDMLSSFTQLLDHSDDAVRIAVAHCILSIVDLADRHDVDIESDISEANKTMARLIHDHSVDWASGDSRKAFEQISNLIKDGETVVTVDLVTVSGAAPRNQAVTGANYRFYEANSNKKGHPVAGYAEAAVIEFFHSHLGAHFNDLFALNSSHRRRENTRMNALFSLLARHPAARSGSTHVEAVRSYGEGSFHPGRMFLDPHYGNSKRSRKVRVADYI